MKTILATIISAISLSASAAEYTLSPGESRDFRINGRWEVITCSDPSTPKCRMARSGSYVTIFANKDEVAEVYGLDNAIVAVKKLKEAGICR